MVAAEFAEGVWPPTAAAESKNNTQNVVFIVTPPSLEEGSHLSKEEEIQIKFHYHRGIGYEGSACPSTYRIAKQLLGATVHSTGVTLS